MNIFNKFGQPVSDYPSPDQIALAVIAAARELDVSPTDVTSGIKGRGKASKIGHARTYAALTLRAIFIDVSNASISRMVGGHSDFLMEFDKRSKQYRLPPWFDDAMFMRVYEQVEATCA